MEAAMPTTFEEFFNLDRIAEPFAAPEIFAHRIGYMEQLPGQCISVWHVVDRPPGPHGGTQVVAKVVYPLATFLPARLMYSAWLMRNGLITPSPTFAPSIGVLTH